MVPGNDACQDATAAVVARPKVARLVTRAVYSRVVGRVQYVSRLAAALQTPVGPQGRGKQTARDTSAEGATAIANLGATAARRRTTF